MTTHTDDEHWALALRHERLRIECLCAAEDNSGFYMECKTCRYEMETPEREVFIHADNCQRCNGTGHQPAITETALLDVLFAWGYSVEIEECEDTECSSKWHCYVKTRDINSGYNLDEDGDTRFAALMAACLAIPEG